MGLYPKIALVTGATGFVGSSLTRRLVVEGWQVHVITRATSELQLLHDIRESIDVHVHDGTTASMLRIVESCEPQIVFHLASLFLSQHTHKDVEALIRDNILFGVQVVEAMIKNRVYSLVNTGTSWQHYEDTDYSPVCLYAATKQAFTDILQFYIEGLGLRVVTLKLYDTYGPGDPRMKLFTLFRRASEGDEVLPMSPGGQLIDLVYIDDVIEAYVTAALRLERGEVSGHEVYAVSSGKLITLQELVDLYVRETGRPLKVIWGGRPYRPREVMRPWRKGERLPEWRARVSLEEGIRKMIGGIGPYEDG